MCDVITAPLISYDRSIITVHFWWFEALIDILISWLSFISPNIKASYGCAFNLDIIIHCDVEPRVALVCRVPYCSASWLMHSLIDHFAMEPCMVS